MDLLGSFLYLVPLAVDVVCIVWFVSLINSQQKGERSILKWREMSSPRKALLGGISVWIFLSVYLALGDELALLNVAVLPLSWIYSLSLPADLWGTTATIVVLAVLFQLRYPRHLITG